MVKLFEKYDFPEGLYYSQHHMWAKVKDGKVHVGLTDYGQQIAGKILMVRPRPIGKTIAQGKILGTMESGKWVGPIKAPVGGVLVEFNEELKKVNTADLVNKDPYGAGWMIVIEPSDLENDLKNLMKDPKEIEVWLKKEIKKQEETK
jgi:glycine cleavage system H protein